MNFTTVDEIGIVDSVQTSICGVKVDSEETLSRLQTNQLVMITTMNSNMYLLGMINQIIRTHLDFEENTLKGQSIACNTVKITLLGTYTINENEVAYKRNLETTPCIRAKCYYLTGENLSYFMNSIARQSQEAVIPLTLGNYSLTRDTKAVIDGDRFFQRHAVVVGSTGSGKSWTVAKLLEQIASLPSADAVVLDIHGEYSTLKEYGISHYKIAGPLDEQREDILFLPHWLLNYEEMLALMLQQKDTNAQNQATVFLETVMDEKTFYLEEYGEEDLLKGLNINTPCPYDIDGVIEFLESKNTERVPGARSEKNGEYTGKLTMPIQRLKTRKNDKRYNFMFNNNSALMSSSYLQELGRRLMETNRKDYKGGVKIINFSEVTSEMLPLAVSLVVRLIFNIQQWVDKNVRHPIAIFCDEAHLYMNDQYIDAIGRLSLENFERVAKEGRKYGVSLVTITQRPSEVSKTILSQSNNYIVMRLTNNEDQNVVKRLVPDSFGELLEQLPVLDIGEAIVIGDSSLLPVKIRVDVPRIKPDSSTIDFWTVWSKESVDNSIYTAVRAMQRQAKGEFS